MKGKQNAPKKRQQQQNSKQQHTQAKARRQTAKAVNSHRLKDSGQIPQKGQEMNDVSYNQPSSEPTPKVQAAGLGGSIASILLWIIGSFTAVEVPAEVGAALATIIAFVAAYMTKDRKPVQAVEIIQGEGNGK